MSIDALLEQIRFDYPLHECQRLFHGRGHAYPGYEHINIDWLPPAKLVTLYAEESAERIASLAGVILERVPECRSLQLQRRYLHGGPMELVLGEAIAETVVEENGLRFNIQLGQAQNTGLFLDMRNGRDWVRRHAQGRRVLNLFAYTCAFSVVALAGGADFVLNMDNNKSVLSRGRENHRLNGQSLEQVRFEGMSVFKSFGRIRKHGPYDLLICDPPSFQKGSVDIRRDYIKILRRAPEFMLEGGLMMLCLNAPGLTDSFIHDMMAETLPRSRLLETLAPPAVFKEAMPGRGLKVVIYQYHA